jgi:hypothetical protein
MCFSRPFPKYFKLKTGDASDHARGYWKNSTSSITKNRNKIRSFRLSTLSPGGRQADSAPPTRSGRAPTTHPEKSSRIKSYPIHRDYPGVSQHLTLEEMCSINMAICIDFFLSKPNL